ncbi:MAG TPA: hypothetical protein VFO54_07955 [Chryseosolibacter sp.]|nr:hypothetical protein [Chryseosolibacter sp.]
MTMIEASPVKVYVAKFFFLVFAFIQWMVAAILLIQFSFSNKNFFISLLFVTLGLIFFYIFLIVNDKVKRVAIGKNKIVIIEGDKNSRFSWPDVKSLKIIPFFNLYKLKLKGKKNPVYFFPAKNIDPAFGLMVKDTSKMGDIVDKKKKEFGIK